MKSIFFLLLGLFTLSQGFCNEREKIYIQPNQISIATDGIFVHLDNQWIPTETLHADANGIYITNDLRDERKWIDWICPHCKTINGPLDFRCKNPNCPSNKKK